MRVTRMLSSTLTKQIRYTNIFSKVPMAPPDPVLGINIAFANDSDARKVNLGVGAYRDDNLKPVVFKVVRKVEEQLVADKSLNLEYIPIDGIAGYVKGSQNLIFGKDSSALADGRVTSVQTLSGTGALRVGFQFIKQELPATILIPAPTWANHESIIKRSGLQFEHYPYYDPATKKVKIDELVSFLQKTKEGNVVLLHACAHNPTGVDPTPQDWKRIADVMEKKHLVPFFDSAYQGFASGDIIKDVQPLREFVNRGFSMFVSQSYAKNMGLYGTRTGALHIVTPDRDSASRVLSQIKIIIRSNYSTPPLTGARIAEKILLNDTLFQEWQAELKGIAERVIQMRKQLRGRLQQLKTPGSWEHITNQIGMFSYTGLTEKQCLRLINHHHVHMMTNGRIAMVGLNSKNVNYVADSINEVVNNSK